MKLVFLGPPGAGKGTLAADAAVDLKLSHISTGEIFREAVRAGTPLGLKVKSILDSGGLVSDYLTVELVKERLAQPDVSGGWILDGFPRTIPQAEALEIFNPPERVVNFDVTDELIIARLAGRRTCPSCKRIYHVTNMPPKKDGVCDACGAVLVIREDDSESSVRHRLVTYRRQTAPLIGFYEVKGRVLTIDAAGSPSVVYEGFRKALR
ncbi:MAG: nucleoside monophosphate kinase [Spirochaetes bacterium]|nr:nucleoside monophosphate kinase [Spirochaetota bacterium]